MIKAIVLDLGKVILDFDNHLITRRLAHLAGRPEDEIYRFIFETPLEAQFNRGEISAREFFRRLTERYPMAVSFEEFVPLWCDIFAPIPGMEALIGHLAGRYPLGILSNTNCLHFEYVRDRYPVVRAIPTYHLSYAMGIQKPDPQIYRRVVSHYGCAPEEVAYTDDIAAYVDAARALGLTAFPFTGAEQLRRDFASVGIGMPWT
jgi:putative hydrolase of the HAD superfamily